MSLQESEPLQGAARLADLAETFPSLRGAPGVRPFQTSTLHEWAQDERRSGKERHAALFILSVSNPYLNDFKLPFALRAWDAQHVTAFVRWVEDRGWH